MLDPFGGGGDPLEAQRLGLTALSGDLNPVAVLIQKAMLEIPSRLAGKAPVNPDVDTKLTTWTRAQGSLLMSRRMGSGCVTKLSDVSATIIPARSVLMASG